MASSSISATDRITASFPLEELYHQENLGIKDDLFHQKHCHEKIKAAASGLSGRCLVLGVGNGFNTPLDSLCAQFETVTIVDYDEVALLRARETVSAERVSRLALIHLDLTGGMVQEWMSHVDGLISSIDGSRPKHFAAFWKKITPYIRALSKLTFKQVSCKK